MNIDPLKTSSQHAYSLQPSVQNPDTGAQAVPAAQDDSDTLSAETTDKVRASLSEMPEIRPEVLERARQLLADPNYPSQEIVNSIAGLITPFSAEE